LNVRLFQIGKELQSKPRRPDAFLAAELQPFKAGPQMSAFHPLQTLDAEAKVAE
jgi:hypothetical protein